MDSVINVVRSAKLEKGELRKEEAAQYDEFAAREMTFPAVRKLCRERGSYSVPSSNTILYLHQNKFRNISGLEKFTACKVLHLENNCIFKVEGISQLVNLRVLHLQSNAISVVEGLDACTNLDTLNISCNPIRDLQGLPESLRTLNAARCGLSQAISLKHIAEMCPQLQVLDLQHNALGGEEAIEALSGLSEARVLYLQGNNLASLPSYRRRLISSLADLSYLDDRPVDDIERVGAAAWSTGGVEAERAARQAYRDAKRNAERRSVTSFALERAARQAMRESLQLVGLQSGTLNEDGTPADASVQHRIVASDAAVEALPIKVLSSIPVEANECAVCSDAFSVGDATSQLPCNHIFHTSCIRPWLLSFSNSCPLCRQTIGGDSHETFLGPGSHLAPLISETLMQRLVRPASAPVRRNRNDDRLEGPCSREGCSRSAVAPPWSAVGGAFTATDLVRHHAMQDNLASGKFYNSDETSGPPVEDRGDAPSDVDPEQLRFRKKMNDMCRRNVGTKSREAESKLAAWNLMKLNKEIRDHERGEHDESAASAQDTSDPGSEGATPQLSIEIPADNTNNAAENLENGAPVGSATSGISDVEEVSSVDSPLAASLACSSPQSEAPGEDDGLPTSIIAAAEASPADEISPVATSDASSTPRSAGSSRTGRTPTGGASEADLLREKLRVERMLRFYANLNEERKQEQERMVKAAAAAAEAMVPPTVEESSEDDDDDDHQHGNQQHHQQSDSGAEDVGCLNDVVLSAAGERMMSTAAAVLSLPTGGVTLDGGDDLWDLGGDITVSSMPYM